MKTNKKTIQNQQSKTMLLFKTDTLEFGFDRHLEHTVNYQEECVSRVLCFLLVNLALSRFYARTTI